MITHDDIGSDEDLAREVLILGRSIAPCILSFADGSEELKNATAILRRVYKDTLVRGSLTVKAQRIGPASVEYSVNSAFDDDKRAALRSLCAAATAGGLPIGSFPVPSTTISGLWPERYEN